MPVCWREGEIGFEGPSPFISLVGGERVEGFMVVKLDLLAGFVMVRVRIVGRDGGEAKVGGAKRHWSERVWGFGG